MQRIGRFFTRVKFSPAATVVLLLVWVLLCVVGGYLCLLPAVGLMMPVYVCYVAARAGRLSALGCMLFAALFGWYAGGWVVALCALLVLLPPVAVTQVMQDLRMDFWPSVCAGACAVFAGGMAVVLIAWAQVGGDLVRALRDALAHVLASSEATDQLLYSLHSLGVLALPEGMEPVLRLGGMYWFNPQARQQLTRSLLLLFETSMRTQLPMQLVSTSILSGVLCVTLPRWLQRGRMDETAEAPVPSFAAWALPRQIGRVLAVTLLAIGALMLMSSGTAFYGAYLTLWAGVRQVMLLQGASTVYFWLKKYSSMRRGGRLAAVTALSLVFGNLMWIVGCADQFLDLRRLRLPIERNEGEDEE